MGLVGLDPDGWVFEILYEIKYNSHSALKCENKLENFNDFEMECFNIGFVKTKYFDGELFGRTTFVFVSVSAGLSVIFGRMFHENEI